MQPESASLRYTVCLCLNAWKVVPKSEHSVWFQRDMTLHDLPWHKVRWFSAFREFVKSIIEAGSGATVWAVTKLKIR